MDATARKFFLPSLALRCCLTNASTSLCCSRSFVRRNDSRLFLLFFRSPLGFQYLLASPYVFGSHRTHTHILEKPLRCSLK